MSLQELSLEYRDSAGLLRQRLSLLRRQLQRETDPEEIWQLKRRIAVLTPMLTEMNTLAELTGRYYERGYYRNARYTCNGIPKQGSKPTANGGAEPYHTDGADPGPAGYRPVLYDTGYATGRLRTKKGRKQIHCQPDAAPRAAEDPQIRAILGNCDDEVITSLLVW